ncbi:deoxyribose-phosphate aldolase [Pinisolibacter sp.]|uniref:deoxyribose-phosphate aldolase n=1 Tax=Pinisolibacter sp. TaxID=2172024 RepID=UPI002FDCA4EB
MTTFDAKAVAARALPLIDLTDLGDAATEDGARDLCARAVTPHGSVAAVCLWPRFVAVAKEALAGTGVKIATVVNFPAGGEDTGAAETETAQAIADGADEIDLVMPYRTFLVGRPGFAESQIVRVKRICEGRAALKVILETGEIGDPEKIRAAADLALAAGADFVKTSTGKVAVNATPRAAEILIEAIHASGRPAGFKAAGGIRTVAEAAVYLDLADRIMGPGWISPGTFRFGASGLLGDVLAALGGGSAATSTGY